MSSTQTQTVPLEAASRRDRRRSVRVPLPRNPEGERASTCRLTDISESGVGFLAPRSDAPLLDDALLLVNVDGTNLVRAVVQRVDLGGASEKWVQVGARFVNLAQHERASVQALVAT